MKANSAALSEWGIGLLLAIALVLLASPWGSWMPPALFAVMSVVVAVLVIGFAAFWWREQPRDERETFNSLRAGRISYMAGGAVLLVGVVVQSFMQHIDPWLFGALGAMVLTKLAVSAWTREK